MTGQQPLPTAVPSLDVYVVSPTGQRLRIKGGKAIALYRAMERFVGQPHMSGEIVIGVANGGVASVVAKEVFR